MKVLIIDDEEDYRNVASMCLGLLGGMDVVQAASGEEGLRKAERENPDVILLDLYMPEMNGIDTFSNLRKNPCTSEIPVIFVTTKGMFPEFDQLKDQGALAVLTKPFDPVNFSAQISDILKSGSQNTN
jgi:two-component system, OmpR family, alkaline phosphatase synthesis response regulator PhoP